MTKSDLMWKESAGGITERWNHMPYVGVWEPDNDFSQHVTHVPWFTGEKLVYCVLNLSRCALYEQTTS
jgi:hypothetical protein